jgi:phosphate-selective porin OprO and OprP
MRVFRTTVPPLAALVTSFIAVAPLGIATSSQARADEPAAVEPVQGDAPSEAEPIAATEPIDAPEGMDPDPPAVPDEPEEEPSPPVVETTPASPAPPTVPMVVVPAAAPAAPAARAVEITGKPGDGLTVRISDAFSLNIRSRIQLRYQLDVPAADDAGVRSTRQLVNIGTARLWFSGHVFRPQLTYMIQLAVAARDYREGAVSPVYDGYLQWAAHRDFNVRAGQFFVPFDRLRTIREFALQLGDRPRPVAELTLDRDVGVMAYSDRFLGDKSPVAWRVGAFGGGGMNLSMGKDPGALMVGRVELRPLGPIDDDSEGDLERRKKPALALGGAFAANLRTNRLRSTTGPTFVGGTTHYYHAAADLVFKVRGFALQGEYLRKWASINAIASTDADGMPLFEYTRSGQGWVGQASYVFDPPIELVGRISRLYALDATDPTFVAELEARGQELGAGVNYYFNGHKLKLQADWIALLPGDFDFGRAAHVAHLQLDVTF